MATKGWILKVLLFIVQVSVDSLLFVSYHIFRGIIELKGIVSVSMSRKR